LPACISVRSSTTLFLPYATIQDPSTYQTQTHNRIPYHESQIHKIHANTQIHTHIYTSCQVHELKTLHRNGMNSHTKQIATNAPTNMQRILPLAFHPPCDRQSQLRHADIQVTTLALGPLTKSVEPKPVSATECPHRNERRCRFQGLFASRSATMFPPPLPLI